MEPAMSDLQRVADRMQDLTDEHHTLKEQLAAKEREIAALREAGEALWVELEDATFGYEGVHWKVQRDAPPALDAWRALLSVEQGRRGR